MTQFIDTLVGIFQSSGFARFGEPGGYLYAIMIAVGCFLLYLAIVKEFEPLILLPMAFGMILANLPGSGVIHMEYFVGDGLEHPMWVQILNNGGLADMLYMGVKLGIYPPLIFLGIGTMTDFAPLISNPKSLLLGLLHSSASSAPTWVHDCWQPPAWWTLPRSSLLPSPLSAVLTAPLLSLLPLVWLLSCWAPSLWQPTVTWRWCLLSSPPS